MERSPHSNIATYTNIIILVDMVHDPFDILSN